MNTDTFSARDPAMSVLSFEDAGAGKHPTQPGFRLQTFEIYNWGTFDGQVHSFVPQGESALLVGENGAGKSTLVDAMLTLLVRPGVRNYNVAAGAIRNERDERTYIRGAYDRTAGQDEKPQIQYLRDGSGYYTALLATFANRRSNRWFTICQVMYLTSTGDRKTIYGFDTQPRTIAGDLGGLTSGSDIKTALVDRGFRVTESYKQYHDWMQRLVRFRPKAMDIFNQTVAVKDVQRLDPFIRDHMLEKRPFSDKVSNLLKHFSELSEAHRALVQVQQQMQLLVPIVQIGARYRTTHEQLQTAHARRDAAGLYFDVATEQLLHPHCEQWQLRIEHLNEQIELLDQSLKAKRNSAAELEHAILHEGGAQLQKLPGLIALEEQCALAKREKRVAYESKLARAGILLSLTSAEQLEKAHQQITIVRDQWSAKREAASRELATMNYRLGVLSEQIADNVSELESLRRRKGNLPDAFIEVRQELCQAFRLSPADLPFVAELVAVHPDHFRWEISIEQVLYAFARTLLVPDDVYEKVSGYVDARRLADARGRGVRLTYDRVTGPAGATGSAGDGVRLPDMLIYRDDHPLTPYVRGEIQSRFDHLACDSVADFQAATQRAMTINRHVKQNRRQHTKDDRDSPGDRRHLVLGWDNKEKRQALERGLAELRGEAQQIEANIAALRRSGEQATQMISLLDEAATLTEFDTIDDHRHEFEASQLRLEKQQLETTNNRVRELQTKLAAVQAEINGLDDDRDHAADERSRLKKQHEDANRILSAIDVKLTKAKNDGTFAVAEAYFATITEYLGQRRITVDNLGLLPREITEELATNVLKLEKRIEPIRNELTKAMTGLLTKFPVFGSDLDPTPAALRSFEELAARIEHDDLPRHERRFKQRLKEKVLQEIGLLYGSLEDEREEIRSKIEMLNEALRRLDWRTGTYMRLEPSDTSDAEIRDFRRELAGCLEGTLDGTDEVNEATFNKIEKLVGRLRDDANLRWREKVIDVRNWFRFAAREFDQVTGAAGSYYDGGTGQSGGEKGKLAFLVLVAAIAYQYDLQFEEPDSERFHFVMVDEMFSRSDDTRAKYALDLFARFGLQLAIVAPLDAKAKITENYVGVYGHVIKDPFTHRSELISLTTQEYQAIQAEES